MRLPIVAGTAFVAGCLGGALGAAIVAHPGWLGFSWTSSAPKAEADERRRAPEAAKRDADDDARRAAEEERRRVEEEYRRRDDQERERRADAPDQKPGVTCAYAAPGLKGAFANESDCSYVQRLFTLTLTTARDGAEPSVWRNVRSGASGTMRIFYTTREADGVMCRRFEQTVTVNGSKVSGVGTACYKNAVWQIAA